jgi:DNA-binding response OmpR family regulator
MRILLVEDEPDAARMIAKGLREQPVRSTPCPTARRAEIAEHAWDESYEPFSNVIEVYLRRLRRKLDVAGSESLIRTRRGEGYALVRPGEERA